MSEDTTKTVYEYSILIDGEDEPRPTIGITLVLAEAREWAQRWIDEGVPAHVVFREIRIETLTSDWRRHP